MKRPSLREKIMAERFAGLKEGDKVLCEGFKAESQSCVNGPSLLRLSTVWSKSR